jgi:hypothetical protein
VRAKRLLTGDIPRFKRTDSLRRLRPQLLERLQKAGRGEPRSIDRATKSPASFRGSTPEQLTRPKSVTFSHRSGRPISVTSGTGRSLISVTSPSKNPRPHREARRRQPAARPRAPPRATVRDLARTGYANLGVDAGSGKSPTGYRQSSNSWTASLRSQWSISCRRTGPLARTVRRNNRAIYSIARE